MKNTRKLEIKKITFLWNGSEIAYTYEKPISIADFVEELPKWKALEG